MIRSLYNSASAMIVQEKKQANLSNNLANVFTTAFKKELVISKEMENNSVIKTEAGMLKKLKSISSGSNIDEMNISFEQGEIKETDDCNDFALMGKGFFKIETQEKDIVYTRDGRFKVDALGYLRHKNGGVILGKNLMSNETGMINTNNEDYRVDSKGNVIVNGKKLYQLELVDFNDATKLENMNNGFYRNQESNEVIAENTTVHQGKLEMSNVNPLDEMVKMLEITRNFESNQKVIQSINDMLGKTVNEVGRVR